MLMPQKANGPDLDWDIANSRGENVELEIKYSRLRDWRGTVRLLGYQNHANMGSYAEAIAAFDDGTDATPDITMHRKKGRVKRGVGINVIQELGPLVRAFGRGGWSGGDYESFAYTEIENTLELGGDVTGEKWRRGTDRVGLAFVTNGISSLHAEYLRLGGNGFILGDGYLKYARERIFEQYYNVHIWKGAFAAEDIQFITNPGYNSDRGPVWIFSARAHLEF
jgi:carbohydrate-selective porin OprB